MKVANNSMVDGSPNLPPAVLLISRDRAWHDAAMAAAGLLASRRFDAIDSPAAALRHLIAGGQTYTHVLLDTVMAANWLDVFSGLTVGEAGTGTMLVRLGLKGHLPDGPLIAYPDIPLLVRTLAAPAPADPTLRPLTSGELVGALQDASITCRFQPIVRIADRRPAGLEVLARLNHPVRGSLPPSMFIPQMERLGYSLHLVDAVFESCLGLIGAAFLEAHQLFLSVNLPLDALLLPETLARLDARRSAAGIPTSRLLIELTESRPVHDIPTLAKSLDRWRELGYRLAIDDMGPEVVNQAGLFDMAFHTVKLDKQIVLRSRTDPLADRYLQRTVMLAQSRSLDIIAEGIEDRAVWDRMAAMGVNHAQGFLMARALPAGALAEWLAHWAQTASLSS